MFAVRPWRMEWEVVKWVALLAIAAGLALLVARSASGIDLEKTRPPALLPAAATELARPMTVGQDDIQTKLWTILHQHQAGLPDEALAGWTRVTLPYETQAWQHVAMGMANLQLGQWKAAAEELELAEQLEPQNALVHYYTAILRLEQARHAKQWYDAIGPVTVRLAAYRPYEVTPNTRDMYEFHAMLEFEKAIANAPHVDRAQPLAPLTDTNDCPVPAVTVGDLLVALGAERFEGQAHNMLGAMYLDRGAYENAEQHLDAAHDAGMNMLFGYRDLGVAYEQEGRFSDAFRAYLKGLGHEASVVRPLQHALESLGRAMTER